MAAGRDRERHLAHRIAEKWLPANVVVSPYVIGEFIQRGQREPFNKTLDEMRSTVNDKVLASKFNLPGFRLGFAKLDGRLSEIYKSGLEAKYLISAEIQGDATDEQGRVFRRARSWVRISRKGQSQRSIMVTGTPLLEVPDPERVVFDERSSVEVMAPAFELVFFDRAARLVAETGVNWKDAFHYLYATWENADAIITTDETFISQFESFPRLPPVEKPSDLELRLRSIVDLHREVFGPVQNIGPN